MAKNDKRPASTASKTPAPVEKSAAVNPDRQGSRPWSELRLDVQEKINELLAKDVNALTPGELEFLNGRRAYLTADQRKDLGLK